MLTVTTRLQIPIAEFQFTFSRSSGPGGQNVNKVNSKATLRWSVSGSPSLTDDQRRLIVERMGGRLTREGEVVLQSQRFRDAGRNVTDCLARLRELLQRALAVEKPRRATRPSRGSVRRRRESKTLVSQKKRLRRPPRPE